MYALWIRTTFKMEYFAMMGLVPVSPKDTIDCCACLKRAIGIFMSMTAALFAAPLAAEILPDGYADRPGFATRYTITPVFADDTLSKIRVTTVFRNDGDGSVLFRLPDSHGQANDYWNLIDNLQVDGAIHSLLGDGVLTLSSKPNNPVSVSYDVAPGYTDLPKPEGTWPDQGPIIHPEIFHALGEMIIPTIDGLEHHRATVQWSGWPETWRMISSADSVDALEPTMSHVRRSNFLAAHGLKIREGSIKGGTIRVGFINTSPEDADAVFGEIQKSVTLQDEMFETHGAPFTVTYFRLPSEGGARGATGIGRVHGYSIFVAEGASKPELQYALANAHTQIWFPEMLGEMPNNPDDMHWFTAGFHEYYTLKTLLKTGLWSREQYVGRLNHILERYAQSPYMGVSKTLLLNESDEHAATMTHLKDRGFMFAVGANGLLLEQQDVDLDFVIYRMMADWKRRPVEARPDILASFLEQSRQSGINLESSIDRYIDMGLPVLLRQGIFGECAEILTENTRKPPALRFGQNTGWRQRVVLKPEADEVTCTLKPMRIAQ